MEYHQTHGKRGHALKRNRIQKPRNVNFFQVPRQLWRRVKKHLPRRPRKRGPGRPRADDRAALNGIWYVLWTGCQWKAVQRDWFGVSSSVIHERFQTWQKQGVWEKVLRTMVRYYARKQHIRWEWQSIDSKSCSSPLGGEQTGKNPTDRAKLGSKIHMLVDQRGAPLAIHVTGARYCQMLWISISPAANIDGVWENSKSSSNFSAWNISAWPLGNVTPALTRATR
jgi:putative transposase